MKQTQKELLQEYSEIMRERLTKPDGSFDESWHQYFVKGVYILAKLTDGSLYRISNPGIKKHFCFDDSHDYEGAIEMARHARTSHDYFKEENMKYLNEMLELVTNPPSYISWERAPNDEDERIANITYRNERWFRHVEGFPVSQEDLDIIADAYRQAIAKHEIRIDRYLKRYGTEHVHSWTYWGDR